MAGKAPYGIEKHYRGFVPPPRVKGRLFTKIFCAHLWFFLMYRMKEDGPHHFFGHHPWGEPEAIHYLEQVDKKYGTRLATDNQH
ncbi:hypothetical protein HDU92_002827 [Lobulomyces angularis]|nr:hypothetical protein HDU92_002827 [Lobulomyces angularis]